MDTASSEAKGEDDSTQHSCLSKAVQASVCFSSGCSVVVPRGTVTGYQDVALLSRTVVFSETNVMPAIPKQPVSMAVSSTQLGLSGGCASSLVHSVMAVGCGTLATGGDKVKVQNSWVYFVVSFRICPPQENGVIVESCLLQAAPFWARLLLFKR